MAPEGKIAQLCDALLYDDQRGMRSLLDLLPSRDFLTAPARDILRILNHQQQPQSSTEATHANTQHHAQAQAQPPVAFIVTGFGVRKSPVPEGVDANDIMSLVAPETDGPPGRSCVHLYSFRL